MVFTNPAQDWKGAVVRHRLLQAAASPHTGDTLLQRPLRELLLPL